jgi:hypothetical protein
MHSPIAHNGPPVGPVAEFYPLSYKKARTFKAPWDHHKQE